MILTIIILITLCCILSLSCYKLYKKDRSIVEYNIKQEKANNKLLEEKNLLENNIGLMDAELKKKTQEFTTLTDTIKQTKNGLVEEATKIANIEIEEAKRINAQLIVDIKEAYRLLAKELIDDTRDRISDCQAVEKELIKLKEKQSTYLKEQQRKEEMLSKQDYYRLCVSEIDNAEIELLRSILPQIRRKDAISKVIWENYYKPAYDILMSHLFKDSKKVCGIYKITCLDNEKAYIGQSVDIRERFRQHIKSALSHEATSNKLYLEMRKYSPSNFTFEILEEIPRSQLDEREKYWIDFYQVKEYGLNSQRGNG